MQKELQEISENWKKIYSRKVDQYRPFEISEDFKRFASIFALGNSYLYIVNLYDFELEYVSESVRNFVSKKIDDLELKDLLLTVIPEELESINLKSRVISDFYTNFLDKDQVLQYKNMFTYKMRDAQGKMRTMLYQAFPLSVLENGAPEHVLCMNTDISHLHVTSTNTVSFIHMSGGKGYFNIGVSNGRFVEDPEQNENKVLSELITEREKQIVIHFSRGLSAEQIAAEMNLSPHTVKTHRRNILNKSGCTNTTELVAKCLTNGVISPSLN